MLLASYVLIGPNVQHKADARSETLYLRNAEMFLRQTPVNWGCSGRRWGFNVFCTNPLFFSPSLRNKIFVILLSFKSRYVDTQAVVPRKTKWGIDRIFQRHTISVFEHL